MLWKRNKVNDEIVIADYNKKNATVTDEMLTVIFNKVASRFRIINFPKRSKQCHHD